ncbi:MAG: MBL fold metallo-hydrolase [Candidatus Thermoplasmatota archaeon]|nr:MBL fold metallo-hydrolase [Candidatus Thermoplasmatota archaeon]
MADHDLPPPPHVRTWSGRVFKVFTRYSLAGLSTNIFLDTPQGRIIVDCGDGCVQDIIEVERYRRKTGYDVSERNLKEAGEAIIGAVISHPHYDHYAGLVTLLNFLQLSGREAPFPILYPQDAAPIESIVDHFTDHLWEEPLFDIDLVPLDDGARANMGLVGISCISSMHRNSRPGKVGGPVVALSYRFEMDGESVVYTGDTGDISPITEFAKGSDLLIMEATFAETSPESTGVHLTLDQVMELASSARNHLLVHFTSGSYEHAVKRGLIDPW